MKFLKEIRLNRIEYRTVHYNCTTDTETKENVKVGTVGVIRFPHYGSYLNQFIEAANIAKADFPYLTDADIKVVHYGGDRYKGTFGIEFNLPDMESAPEGYSEIHQLELTK